MNPLTYHRIEKLTLEIRQRQDEIEQLLNKDLSERVMSSVVEVVRTVAKAFSVKQTDICSTSHAPANTEPRHVAIWICVKLWYDCCGPHMSKTEIGKQFGKTHGAVIWAVKNVNDWRDTDKKFLKKTDELLEICRSIRNPKQLTLFKAA